MLIPIVVSVLIAVTGGVILGMSALKYRKMTKLIRMRSYQITAQRLRRQRLQECLTFLFAGSYLIGVVQSLATRISWLFLLEGILFLLCAVFFYIMIGNQLQMEDLIRQRKLEILRTFVNAIDRKDAYTRGHSEHVFQLVELIHAHLPEPMRISVSLPKLLDAAILHDIGKIGISDSILKKRDPLTDDEWTQMRRHAREGKRLLDDTCFTEIANWVLYHHERIDGRGYEGLPGADIPLESRIIAIADTFSALTTNREYRSAMSTENALRVLKSVAGTQLDSQLLECFFTIPLDRFAQNG